MLRRTFGALVLLICAVLLKLSVLCRPVPGRLPVSPTNPPLRSAAPGERPNPTSPRHRSAQSVPGSYRADPLQFLSTAPVDSLVLLPGIGPVIAQRIVSARTGKSSFTRWEDLLAIKGIGPKKLERLREVAIEN